jgi:hypothetical protein
MVYVDDGQTDESGRLLFFYFPQKELKTHSTLSYND